MTEDQWALFMVLDGTQRHHLAEELACTEVEAERIWSCYQEAEKAYFEAKHND